MTEDLMMALPGSGKIGLNQIGAEFEDPAPIKILETPKEVLWQIDPRLKNKPVRFSNFYGKTNTVFVNITGSPRNVNIDALVNKQGKGHVLNIVVNVKSGTRVGSNSASSPAIQTGAFGNNNQAAIMWINIEPVAFVYGRGGLGGAGAKPGKSGQVGFNGGDAILVNGAGTVRINNHGLIAAGGGGGGGGGGYFGCHKGNKAGCTKYDSWSGEGGRGGTGNPSGANGAGTKTGNGGSGGNGGGLGQNGLAGARSGTHKGKGDGDVGEGGAGGHAGIAVRKTRGKVVYDNIGDIRGARQ